MPNRILKESICTSETINKLSTEAENFFYRLIVVADDFGRMDARPAILIGRCFPLRLATVKEKHIDQWLYELQAADLIQQYAVEGKSYLQITTWTRHQQTRAQHSKYPALTSVSNHMQSNDGIRMLIPSYTNTNTNTNTCASPNGDDHSALQEESDRMIRDLEDNSPVNRNDYSADFERFWDNYPRHINKQAAYKAWKARLREGNRPDDLIGAAENYAAYCLRAKTAIEYVKHATTFLGSARPFSEFVEGRPDESNLPQGPDTKPTPAGIGDTLTAEQRADFERLKAKGVL